MTTKPITLQLPETLYEIYRQRAEVAHRSVEDEVLQAVAASAPSEGVSPELANEMEALKLLSDKALRKVAQERLPLKDARRAEQLHFKQQREGRESITPPERQFLDDWLKRYDYHVLRRSHTLLLLKQRGYELSEFLKPQ